VLSLRKPREGDRERDGQFLQDLGNFSVSLKSSQHENLKETTLKISKHSAKLKSMRKTLNKITEDFSRLLRDSEPQRIKI
jgi:hypothetical protein